jgi:hypothetical protein
MALRLLAQAASQSPHVRLGDDRSRLGGCRCERKQHRGRFLGRGQRALKNHWLVDDMAAPEVADRHDQTSATVAVAKVELARIRPSAAVPSFGMCPEPAPIKPVDLIQRARHRDRGLPSERVWPAPLAGHTNSDPGERTTLEFITADEHRRKRYRTLGFSKYYLKSFRESLCQAAPTVWLPPPASTLQGSSPEACRVSPLGTFRRGSSHATRS